MVHYVVSETQWWIFKKEHQLNQVHPIINHNILVPWKFKIFLKKFKKINRWNFFYQNTKYKHCDMIEKTSHGASSFYSDRVVFLYERILGLKLNAVSLLSAPNLAGNYSCDMHFKSHHITPGVPSKSNAVVDKISIFFGFFCFHFCEVFSSNELQWYSSFMMSKNHHKVEHQSG